MGHTGGTLHAHPQGRVLHRASIYARAHRASISHLCLCSSGVLCRALCLVEHYLLVVLLLVVLLLLVLLLL